MLKKLKPVSLLLLLACIMILFTGCHEEEKYNAAKNSFLQAEEEWSNAPCTIPSNDHKTVIDEEAVKKHEETGKTLEAKLAELQKLAKSETKLNNDYLQVKEHYEETKNGWNQKLALDRDYAKREKDLEGKETAPAVDDPWTKYGTTKLDW